MTDPVASPPLAPVVSRAGGLAVIWLDGEQDIATVPALADVLARTIAADGGNVMVDLSATTFIDAATIGVLVRSRNFLNPDSRRLTVRSPATFVRHVLEVCELSGLLEPLPDDGAPPTPPSSSLGRTGS